MKETITLEQLAGLLGPENTIHVHINEPDGYLGMWAGKSLVWIRVWNNGKEVIQQHGDDLASAIGMTEWWFKSFGITFNRG